MNLNVLGFIIFFVGLLLAYIGFVAYVTFWTLIANKVESDFVQICKATFDDGSEGYIPVVCFIANRWNKWIYKMYKKKFGFVA